MRGRRGMRRARRLRGPGILPANGEKKDALRGAATCRPSGIPRVNGSSLHFGGMGRRRNRVTRPIHDGSGRGVEDVKRASRAARPRAPFTLPTRSPGEPIGAAPAIPATPTRSTRRRSIFRHASRSPLAGRRGPPAAMSWATMASGPLPRTAVRFMYGDQACAIHPWSWGDGDSVYYVSAGITRRKPSRDVQALHLREHRAAAADDRARAGAGPHRPKLHPREGADD